MDTGPFVHVATFCRDIVEHADGNVSLIGVTDSATIAPDEEGHYVADLKFFISIRSGDVAGKHSITIRPVQPSGDLAFEEGQFPALFEGGQSGVEIQVGVQFEVPEEGNYWFELRLDGERLLTRIPLALRFESSSSAVNDDEAAAL